MCIGPKQKIDVVPDIQETIHLFRQNVTDIFFNFSPHQVVNQQTFTSLVLESRFCDAYPCFD